MKGINGVKYVDINPGSSVAYLRFESAESVDEFTKKSTEERKISVITGALIFA